MVTQDCDHRSSRKHYDEDEMIRSLRILCEVDSLLRRKAQIHLNLLVETERNSVANKSSQRYDRPSSGRFLMYSVERAFSSPQVALNIKSYSKKIQYQ